MNLLPAFSRERAVKLGAADHLRLADLCRECTDFFELVEGQAGGPMTAEEILGPLPGRITSGRKHVFGIERNEGLVGVAEILEGFPTPSEWQIGLLMLLPRLRGVGLGTNVWLGIRDWIYRQGGSRVRLIVQKQNLEARGFWEKNGFSVEREAVVEVGKLSSTVWVMWLHLGEATHKAVAADAVAAGKLA
jgi:ribosomal protein S18 acetylase RimI-like enzyme